MQPAHRLGAQTDELLTAIGQVRRTLVEATVPERLTPERGDALRIDRVDGDLEG